MITFTTLRNPAFTKKLLSACREAIKTGQGFVDNRYGNCIAYVKYEKGKFKVTTVKGHCMRDMIHKAYIFCPIQFWRTGLGLFALNRIVFAH